MKKRKSQERILTVTKEDYEREVAGGADPKDALNPGKYRFRRATRLASSEDLTPRNIKLMVTMRLDSDVVEFFKARAKNRGAAGYQTQINDALRSFMEGKVEQADFSKLLENETFIAAVAERVRLIR